MKDKTLKQYYPYDKHTKTYHVHINLDTYRDVYSDWDFAPMVNRDMDDDLNAYILESSYEITLKRKMAITFHLPENLFSAEREEKSIIGIRNFQAYQIRKLKGKAWRLFRTSLIFLLLGILLLVIAGSMGLRDHLIWYETLREGMYIGAWVALWEIFSIWFFQLATLRLEEKHLKRLMTVPILYAYK